MSIDPLLQLLRRQARHSHQELAELLSLSEEEVVSRIAAWEKNGTILGYQAVIDSDQAGDNDVSAFIEVKLTPERKPTPVQRQPAPGQQRQPQRQPANR